MRQRLSGLALEYAILEIYSRDAGQRSAKISFNVGQGSQDIGFRNDVIDRLHRPARAAHHAARQGRERAARHGVIHHPRPPGPHLSRALQAPRARFLLPAADLSRRWRNRAAAGRLLHRRSTPAAPNTCPHHGIRRRRQRPRRTLLPTGSLDRSRRSTAGIPATTTSTPPAARIT